MEQQNTAPEIIQDAAFRKRRSQKNWIVLGLIVGSIALIWSVTMIKIKNGMSIAHPVGLSVQDEQQKINKGGADAQ